MAKDHEKVWREAVEAAVKAFGLQGLKRTSMFMVSSRRATAKKAA